MVGQTKKTGAQKAVGFETAMAELEKIVSDMEAGKLSLEDSLTAYKRGAELLSFCRARLEDAQPYKRGAELLSFCRARLEDAQQQVRVLEDGVLKDFSATGVTDKN
jgi:exodeoxyribonuclease VII small subunit